MCWVNISTKDIYKGIFWEVPQEGILIWKWGNGNVCKSFSKNNSGHWQCPLEAKPSMSLEWSDHPGQHAARGLGENTWVASGTGAYFGEPVRIAVGVIGSSWQYGHCLAQVPTFSFLSPHKQPREGSLWILPWLPEVKTGWLLPSLGLSPIWKYLPVQCL